MVPLSLLCIVLVTALAVSLAKLLSTRSALVTEQEARRADAEIRRQADAAYEQRVADLERATAEKIALVEGNREHFAKEMRAISSEVLKGATTEVAKLNDEARKAGQEEFALRAKALGETVTPIAERLTTLDKRVEELQAERGKTLAAMKEMVSTQTVELQRLRGETGALVSALKRPQVRGSWGEIQLKNVARIAGMTERVDFNTQVTVDDGDGGRVRPDMTVHLPTGRDIVVDSKVPLDAYLAALECTDDATRDEHLDRHAAQLRTHLDTLATKAYHAKLENSAEFVVCFIPNEACYVAALDHDPTLLERGAEKNVLIATPTTLLALLHATHYGWRQAEVEESAREIAAAGRELHKRCATFLESFAKVGRQLTSATNAYNDAVGSAESRMLPQLRRLESLDAKSERSVTRPARVDSVARTIVAELPVANHAHEAS
ncbi:MAG: DNA recombination protein RmuC [Baekduiaceae bacterium]